MYDFSRITVADTIRHLQYVAQKEGVNVSEEALNVVAQKADGGMRDALSIFDQMVSFCGNDISYEQAIEVLNVLDTDYYFRLVDAALQSDVSASLLLLNQVLQKGFDAGHFVTGFAQHLRDVLVSKDASTVQLLEASESIRHHYQEQAQRCAAKWLFNALDIMNTCDIQYRTAKNKRLTVEIALVKLCRLMEPATPSSVANTQSPTSNTQSPKTNTQSPTSNTQSPNRPIAQSPLGNMPSLGNLGIIGGAKKAESTTVVEEQKAQRTSPFTADQLIDAWVGLRAHFRGEERLLAMLKNCQPEIIGPELCQITVANPWQKQEFGKFGPKVMTIVRDTLQNDLLKLQVVVAEFEREERAYTAADKYKLLSKQNPHLVEMKDRLNLLLE